MFSTRLILLCALASLPTAATRPAPAITEQSVRRVATLHTARAVHTATPLLSGDILIVGGMTEGGGAAASADPTPSIFRRILERSRRERTNSLRDRVGEMAESA